MRCIFEMPISPVVLLISYWDEFIGLLEKAFDIFMKFTPLGQAISFAMDLFSDDDPESPQPQVVSQGQVTAKEIKETSSTSKSEVTIKTDSGSSAAVTKGNLGNGLNLQASGAF